MRNKMSKYSKLTDHSKELIAKTAIKHTQRQREKGKYKPLSFSTLDQEYSDKFHEIYQKEKSINKKTTKLDVFKMLIDKYNQCS